MELIDRTGVPGSVELLLPLSPFLCGKGCVGMSWRSIQIAEIEDEAFLPPFVRPLFHCSINRTMGTVPIVRPEQ